MKRNDWLKEIKGLSADDLRQRRRSLSEELMKLRFRRASGQLERPNRMREVRRNLARLNTIISGAGK